MCGVSSMAGGDDAAPGRAAQPPDCNGLSRDGRPGTDRDRIPAHATNSRDKPGVLSGPCPTRPGGTGPGGRQQPLPTDAGVRTMVRPSKLMIAAALVLGAGGPLTAATAFADPEVQGRFENQQDRIEQGYDNGSLTRGEACQLEGQEHRLH